ncbi:UDP-N-acetylmuramoyl-tripeptide--D-alanyl-D-alanine ligase [Thermosyntropha sp.]|uniref:UDP-N-acetylmuramoyl-tripeptide--D-alanyl-D- alanine ligase n=1 Tax=Thermosyntropha sp. TaxID=2740820 RepID=UPI0025FF92C6|nr:UDP-N-acetylmuramoyl-tripeptide--D-alanyl-D-alanine ligase [Thermosyntropha sp.]MBO8159318.1 UDP-N-acetylmuramoyl-tripeptide--D-alanyl-D-alanine ligase [Thermosyntropha sp.]
MKLSIDFICQSVSGKILHGENAGFITDVNIDSRRITPQSLFIALQGERFDGHDFILEAFEKGACAAIVHKDINTEKIDKDKVLIRVEDTLKALQMLAKSYREQFEIPVVAVTGSVGKTTTKEIIASCLSSQFNTLKTEGNYNNDIGVPLTIFRLEGYHQAAVIEMAMRAKGEIDRLADIVRPFCAVITNVEPVHLETLGSLENIAHAKCEVLPYVSSGGFALLNGDNEILLDAAKSYSCRKYTFGYNKDCDFRIVKVDVEKKGIKIKTSLLGKDYSFHFPSFTSKLAYNAVAAIALSYLLGIDVDKAINDMANYAFGENRLNVLTFDEGGTVINDTYNANPLSMEAALETGRRFKKSGRFVAVLGDMYELGDYEVPGHLKVGLKAFENKVDILVAVGEKAEYIAKGALEAGMNPENVYYFKDKELAQEFLRHNFNRQDTVLFKASRGMKLETMIEDYLRFLNDKKSK